MPRRMGDVDGVSKAVEPDSDARDIAVGDGIDMLALNVVSLHVYTSVEVVGTRLTEIPRQQDIVVHWRGKNVE